MAIFPTLPSLLDRMKSVIYKNDNQEIKAELHQPMLRDVIETLWDKASQSTSGIIPTTYTDLLSLYQGNSLVPGALYSFEYEAVHDVVGSGGTNVQVTAPTPNPTETFIVMAIAENKLDGRAISVDNPKDYISYDIEFDTVLGQPAKGRVLERHCPLKNIKTPFDFRNHIVLRISHDFSSLPTDLGTAARRILVDTGSFTGYLLSTGRSIARGMQTFIQDDGSWDDMLYATGPIYPFEYLDIVTYIQSIDYATCADIDILSAVDKNTPLTPPNVYITESQGITSLGMFKSSSIKKGNGINLGDKTFGLIINDAGDLIIGGDVQGMTIHKAYYGKIGAKATNTLISFMLNFNIGGNNESCAFGSEGHMSSCTIGGSNFDLLISGANPSVGSNCVSITNLNSRNFEIKDNCNEIHLADSSYSEIGNACGLIDLLNIGAGETGAGGINHSNIGDSVYDVQIAATFSGLRRVNIGDACTSIVFNGNALGVSLFPNTANKTIQPSATDAPNIKGNYVNESTVADSTIPTHSVKNLYYWDVAGVPNIA